jgi:translation initiation factor IF-3
MKNTSTAQDRWFVNNSIRVPRVICINSENKNIGVLPTKEALKMAQDQGLDLVQVSAPSKDKPPTCKIMDYGKFKYDADKSRKEAEKKQRESAIKVKTVKFKPRTGIHDLEIKAHQTSKFLKDNCKVKVAVVFKGREISHQQLGAKILEQFLSFIPENSFRIEGSAEWEGKDLVIFLAST